MRQGFGIDDLLDSEILSDAQLSPAGDPVAYVVAGNGSPKKQRSPESRIWLASVEGSDRWRATHGPGTDRQPRWSPDGTRLAFLSDRDKRGTAQLYLFGDSPGEARRLTDLRGGITTYAWSPDGSRLAATSLDHVPEIDEDVMLFDAERRFQRLFMVDVESGAAEPVHHGDLHIWELCWAPDGCAVAAIVTDEPYQWAWYDARLVRIDIGSGDVTTLYKSERQIARPAWSPDGTDIALITCRWSDPGMSGGDLILVDTTGGEMRNLTDGERRSHLQASWLPGNETLVSIAWDRARAQICMVDRERGSTPLWTDEQSFADFSFSHSARNGRVATVLSSRESPGEVRAVDLEGLENGETPTAVVTSPTGDRYPVLDSRWLSWNSTDGREIEGLYIEPARFGDSDTPPAMVVLIHGGPTGVSSVSYPLAGTAGWAPLLREQGIAVLMPNYRGSNGYGVEFAEANLGDLGGLDLQDVLSGVDQCVQQGLADPDRLGIGGWSYGGFLTALAITRTTRFRAAVAGASITNWYSFHGSTNIPGFANQYVCAVPWSLDGDYARISPLFQSGNVETPTLFLHGERDPVCPVGQAYEMTRALRRCGVETECVVYPREPHGIGERAHRRDMMIRAVGWFQTHLDVS